MILMGNATFTFFGFFFSGLWNGTLGRENESNLILTIGDRHGGMMGPQTRFLNQLLISFSAHCTQSRLDLEKFQNQNIRTMYAPISPPSY